MHTILTLVALVSAAPDPADPVDAIADPPLPDAPVIFHDDEWDILEAAALGSGGALAGGALGVAVTVGSIVAMPVFGVSLIVLAALAAPTGFLLGGVVTTAIHGDFTVAAGTFVGALVGAGALATLYGLIGGYALRPFFEQQANATFDVHEANHLNALAYSAPEFGVVLAGGAGAVLGAGLGAALTSATTDVRPLGVFE